MSGKSSSNDDKESSNSNSNSNNQVPCQLSLSHQAYLMNSIPRACRRFSLPGDLMGNMSSSTQSTASISASTGGTGRSFRRRGSTGDFVSGSSAAFPFPVQVQIPPLQRRMRRFSLPASAVQTPASSLLVYVDPNAEKPTRLKRLRRCRSSPEASNSRADHANCDPMDTAECANNGISRWYCESVTNANYNWDANTEDTTDPNSEFANHSVDVASLGYGPTATATTDQDIPPLAPLRNDSNPNAAARPPRMPQRDQQQCLERHPSLPDLKLQDSTPNPPRMPRRSSFAVGDHPALPNLKPQRVLNASFPKRSPSGPRTPRMPRRSSFAVGDLSDLSNLKPQPVLNAAFPKRCPSGPRKERPTEDKPPAALERKCSATKSLEEIRGAIPNAIIPPELDCEGQQQEPKDSTTDQGSRHCPKAA